jgi:hypothetical protein
MPKRSHKPQSSPLLAQEGLADKWLTVCYQPVSLFSLKSSDATSMAARSNLVPTPYAIKMALLKVLIESEGNANQSNFDAWMKQEFTWIRDLQIYISPPERLVVNRNGYKLRYYDQTADKADKTRSTVPMQDGFVFREWIFQEGLLSICCGQTTKIAQLSTLFSQINYFGKRGCFFQFLPDQTQQTLEPRFQHNSASGFIVQLMDDLGKETTFTKINPYSTQKAILGKDRVIETRFLPMKLAATSARYDLYKRL